MKERTVYLLQGNMHQKQKETVIGLYVNSLAQTYVENKEPAWQSSCLRNQEPNYWPRAGQGKRRKADERYESCLFGGSWAFFHLFPTSKHLQTMSRVSHRDSPFPIAWRSAAVRAVRCQSAVQHSGLCLASAPKLPGDCCAAVTVKILKLKIS